MPCPLPSSRRRLVDMGFAEQVSVDRGEGQQPTMRYATRQGGGSGGTFSEEGPPGTDLADEASSSSGGSTATGIDAILEAARAGDSGGAPTPDAPAGSSQQGEPDGGGLHLQVDEVDRENPLRPRYTGAWAGLRMQGPLACRGWYRAGVVPTRPSSSGCAPSPSADFAGNVLVETNEPFNLNIAPGGAPLNVKRPGQGQQQQQAERRNGVDLPPPPARRNPMARQLPPQQPISRSPWRQQRPPAGQPPTQPDRGESPAEAALPGAPAVRPPTAIPKAAPRLRPAPPLPQRQDLRPWQVAGASAPKPVAGGSISRGITTGGGVPRPRQPGPPDGAPEGRPTEAASHVVQLADRLSLVELRQLCERKGLPTYGTKAQLAGRLVQQQRAQHEE